MLLCSTFLAFLVITDCVAVDQLLMVQADAGRQLWGAGAVSDGDGSRLYA